MNLFVCECFEKKYPTITLIDCCFGLKLEGEYLKIFYQDDLFICCVQMVNFCYKVNRWYFFSRTCAVSSDLFSCYVSLMFGVKSLCTICIRPLVKKLFPYLRKK